MRRIAVRFDKNAVALFDRATGTKVRFAVGSYTKASKPELVDIKITDWCDMGCSFCLDPNTLVTTSSFKRVKIADLKVGDKILGFPDPDTSKVKYRGEVVTVKAIWATKKDAVKISFDDGKSIICSLNHKFLSARMGWKEASELTIGSRIRNIQTTPEHNENEEYKIGYLAGYSRGDGAYKDNGHGGNGRWIRLSCNNKDVIDRIYSYMETLNLNPKGIKELWLPDGYEKTCWAVEKRSKVCVEWFTEARNISVKRSDDYSRGFVAGFFDAEGSSNGCSTLRFHQKNDMEAMNFVKSVLNSYNFKYSFAKQKNGMSTITLSSNYKSVERFMNTFLPAHSYRNNLFEGKTKKIGVFSNSTVTKIEHIGERDLIDIETSSGTFFAEGLATHNCYQDSTLLGKHASMENIQTTIERLSKVKVQEIAYGGGETTGHPHFVEILKMTRDAGIIPNFTTKKPAAVRNLWKDISPLIGGFAYSAENAGQVRSAAKLLRMVPKERASLHYVMGLGDKDHFMEYMRAASEVGWRVTLLGYKITGRGKDVIPFPYDWWIDAVNELIIEGNCPSLSIDTPLAEQYDGKMPVENYMYHTREGAFSMAIDAVAMKFGASSFSLNEELIPFDENWRKHYKKM